MQQTSVGFELYFEFSFEGYSLSTSNWTIKQIFFRIYFFFGFIVLLKYIQPVNSNLCNMMDGIMFNSIEKPQCKPICDFVVYTKCLECLVFGGI